MTIGVGGSTAQAELARMDNLAEGVEPIQPAEHEARIERARALMKEKGVSALYLDTSPSLLYFTGMRLKPTERLHGAVIPADGPLIYLSPVFEIPKTETLVVVEGDIRGWEEHEDPTALVIDTVESLGIDTGVLAIDPATPFFTADGLRKAGNRFELTNGSAITAECRMYKSPGEIALLQRANEITLEIHKAAARILHEGITTSEVQDFILEAFARCGGTPPGGRPAVQFGEATAYPHGVPYGQTLRDGDMVLMDFGCFVGDYRADITRTYVFGEPGQRQREIWELEKAAQAAGFAAAVHGAPCEAVDIAARGTIESAGFAKDYGLPGLPHRTGHGIGLEVHEDTYMVRNNRRPMDTGLCFSVEPMICIYGEFGVRLEDCAYMAEEGARWFTQPAASVDDPFGYESA